MKTFDEIYETLPSGWLSKPEAKLLYDTALLTIGPILEVGCYRGRSSVLLASLSRRLHCVDPFDRVDTSVGGDAIRDEWLENLAGYDNIILHEHPVEEWTPRLVSFAYLDGDHSYQGTVNQISAALECSPSYIAIHDVNDSGGGLEVKRAAIKLLGDWQERVERLAVWKIR